MAVVLVMCVWVCWCLRVVLVVLSMCSLFVVGCRWLLLVCLFVCLFVCSSLVVGHWWLLVVVGCWLLDGG